MTREEFDEILEQTNAVICNRELYERAIKALKEISDLKEVYQKGYKEAYQKGYKDGQEMVEFHLELCKEEQSSILEDIKAIINTPNTIIQEDVLKYKMICEVLKNEGYN